MTPSTLNLILSVLLASSVTGWMIVVYRHFRSEYQDALDRWQRCILQCKSLHEDNNRLLDKLNNKTSADWWKDKRN